MGTRAAAGLSKGQRRRENGRMAEREEIFDQVEKKEAAHATAMVPVLMQCEGGKAGTSVTATLGIGARRPSVVRSWQPLPSPQDRGCASNNFGGGTAPRPEAVGIPGHDVQLPSSKVQKLPLCPGTPMGRRWVINALPGRTAKTAKSGPAAAPAFGAFPARLAVTERGLLRWPLCPCLGFCLHWENVFAWILAPVIS